MRWFRYYSESVSDPKVQCLEPPLFKQWINLLCIASDNDGKIPVTSNVAWLLHVTLQDLEAALKALEGHGLMHNVSNQHSKAYAPHSWSKRQYKSDSSAERVQRFRNGKCNVTVTPPENRVQSNKKNKQKKAVGTTKGTRLPTDWKAPKHFLDYATEKGLSSSQANTQLEQFKDYWISKSGQGATKTNWFAVWRNWVNNGIERGWIKIETVNTHLPSKAQYMDPDEREAYLAEQRKRHGIGTR